MARRGRKKTFRTYARRARSFGGGKSSVTKNILDGAIVGIANTALPKFIPMQEPLVTLGVGWFRKNPTLATLGGVQLGAALGSMVGGGLGQLTGGGGASQV